MKILLLHDGQRIGKKKTAVKKKTLNPTFNESFMFDLPPACSSPVPGSSGRTLLRGIRLQFIVYDWDRVTRNEVIGRLEMGDRVHEPETPAQHHWNEIVNSPRKQVAEWHRLQPWPTPRMLPDSSNSRQFCYSSRIRPTIYNLKFISVEFPTDTIVFNFKDLIMWT